MARPGKFDHLKPEIFRLIEEGVTQADIRRQYPGLPKGTLSAWANAINPQPSAPKPSSEPPKRSSELPPLPPRPRLPIDPESPLEKIKHALWDIVYDPEGKGTAVQALNILLRIEAPWLSSGGVEPQDGNANDIRVTRTIVNAQNS